LSFLLTECFSVIVLNATRPDSPLGGSVLQTHLFQKVVISTQLYNAFPLVDGVSSGQSGLTLQLFPLEIIVTPNGKPDWLESPLGTLVKSNLVGQHHLVNHGNPLYNRATDKV